jgi:pimeloyl-ACP methyl ester carboxylesterase
MAELVVDGIQTYYELPRGRPAGPGQVLTLFLHGAGGSSEHWGPLLPRLADRVRPLLVDLPGLGRSGGTVLKTVIEAVLFLDHVLSELHASLPLVCVGHSLGGLIAQQFALSYPTRVERLVLIATAPRIRPHPDFVRAARTGDWDLEQFRTSFGQGVPREVQDLVLGELPKTRLTEGASSFMDDLDLGAQVAALAMPTLIIAGGDDIIISPRHSRQLHQKIRNSALLVVPGAGHYVQVEQPDVVAEALNQFISSAEASPQGSHVPARTERATRYD